MNQERRLLTYLQSHNSITRLVALTELGIFELASVINRLERKGHYFSKKRITVTNRFGESAHVSEYSLREQGEAK